MNSSSRVNCLGENEVCYNYNHVNYKLIINCWGHWCVGCLFSWLDFTVLYDQIIH